ncbi:Adiponectin receptor protein [Trichostrongylus colubriformis]|uniref:Adiponectin receptor protein n=1 Tax=Trichostrongylus colubriformis TaxID=6319 RepID=A0AAN8F135_TRICO
MDDYDEADGSSESQSLLDAATQLENQEQHDDDNVLVMYENGDLQVRNREDSELQSPMRSVDSVLREAENIMTDGPLQASGNRENQQVLLDEVNQIDDACCSPKKSTHPIEVVVRHSKVVEQPTGDSDDEDGDNRGGQSRRLSTVVEGQENESQKACSSSMSKGLGGKWSRGHRRAWSMPNAKGEKMTLAILHDDETLMNGNTHKRRVLRCRLHPNKKGRGAAGFEGANEDSLPTTSLRFDLSGMPHPDEDDNELEVEINEEEVVVPGESGKGARTIIKKFWEARWKATNFETLPEWLQDNEYLRTGHRPPLPSFSSCFKSIFALHTETGNIWTHMYGCVAFIGVALWFLTRPSSQIQFMEKIVFSTYFLGAILCLGMSFIFHTVACHSDTVGKLFSKLDYAGIALLIVGSFIPWLYYAFYCRPQPMVIYITMISVLGLLAMIVSLWDKFSEPAYRPLRAGVFVAMGLSAVIPAAHLLFVDGLDFLYQKASLVWMLLMGGMYIGGATIYATRIPERWFPGRCDLWFQSHQLFHTFVVIAAFIHFHSITVMAQKKLMEGSCAEQLLER